MFGTYKDIDIVLEQQQRNLNAYTHQIRLFWRENDMVLLIIRLALHLRDDTTPPIKSLPRPDMPSRLNFCNCDGLNELERLYRRRDEVKAFRKWLYEELREMTSLMLQIEDP
jgi:hypothetical protein